MSSFSPSSPLHLTEGAGQGIIGKVFQRQCSRTTSIHVLDDDSLLNIFNLCRPIVTVTDRDEDFDEFRYGIIRGKKWNHEKWWYKPAHVCRRWRNLILGSASYLGLCLVCTPGTPVANMLANSPPFPLVIDYIDAGRHITAEDEEGILLALEQPNRIRCIRVGLPPQILQKIVRAINHDLPILEYLVMAATLKGENDTFVFPETTQAPHLLNFGLIGVPPPIGSRLLTTAVGLVTLRLFMHHSFNHLSPYSLFQWISPLSQLETLEIITNPNLNVETQPSQTSITTHATFPNLRLINFVGVSAFLEVLVRQIATPRLEKLRVKFFEQLAFSIPCLVQFMNTTENTKLRFDSARLVFSGHGVCVETYPREENRRCSFEISVDGWDISSVAQIVDALGEVFSAVEYLILYCYLDDCRTYEEGYDLEEDFELEDDIELEVDRTEWYKLLRPFSKVKSLCVNHGLVKRFSRYLRVGDGELPSDFLPELQELTYSGSRNPGDAFTSFIDARQNAGCPVSFKFDRRGPSSTSLRLVH